MRVVFAGSPAVAVPTLRTLAESDHELVGVLTQPARPVGRKRLLKETPVSLVAGELGVPVATPDSAEGLVEAVRRWSPDIAIVVAYGRMLSERERDSVPGGWWNVHFSLLPRWRGAAPVPYAIAAGDTETGLTIFRIEEGLDTGVVAAKVAHPIAPHDTTSTLLAKLADVAPSAVLSVLEDFQSGTLSTVDQSGEPTYAPKPSPEVGELRWAHNVDKLYNSLRAWGEEPGCFATRADNDQRVKILRAWPEADTVGPPPGELRAHSEGVMVGTGTLPLVLARVQPAGKPDMDAGDWWRGLPDGVRFRA
ncbi:MAG TPA: methionyl-tRNA formyltransferase [Pontimonas sp.]|nr:methionyl-tRNA formyltransferase [Pontimonas sp.]